MSKLKTLLDSQSCILIDGAMGTMLFAAGLESGNSPEEWNVLYPDKVAAIHRAYIEAGARIILTNTFGGTQFRLKLHNFQNRGREFNLAGAKLARMEADLAPHTVLVAGSMGPTGELLEPMGLMTYDQAKSAFAGQAQALAEGGVDLLWIETMSDLNEVKAAIEGARSVCELPLVATMSFHTRGHTMMGVSPAQAVQTLAEFNLAAIGANCGTGVDELLTVIEKMRAAEPNAVLVAKGNAGIPRWEKGNLVYDGSPAVMADYAQRLSDAGAQLIGACCGSSPAHILAMAKALDLQ